jgi:hypothetical protein
MKLKSWMSLAILISLSAIIACGGGSKGSGGGNRFSFLGCMDIFPPASYDTGIMPVIAGVEKSNIIIEMHQDNLGEDFYYHVATVHVEPGLTVNTVNWGPSHEWISGGLNPSIAVSEGGVVAEAHEEGDFDQDDEVGDGNIITTIGIASVPGNNIAFGSGQKLGNTLYKPAICITRDGTKAVLIYEGNKEGTYTNNKVTLWYRVGNVDAVNKTISWGPAVAYDTGIYPSISINNLGHIITVHSSWQSNTALWYKVGQLNSDNTVAWGPTVSFNAGEIGASVSIGDDPGDGTGSALIMVYPSRLDNGALWVCLGNLDTGSTNADWVISTQYGHSSEDVMPACSYAFNQSAVEVHDGNALFGWKLWYGFAE